MDDARIIAMFFERNEGGGNLRVVTNRAPHNHLYPPSICPPDGRSQPLQEPENSFYCLSIKDLSVMAKVENFYKFENEYPFLHVSFQGNDIYVCPKADLVSPVIHFDLSDLDKITYETIVCPYAYDRYWIELGDNLYLTVRHTDGSDSKRAEVVRFENNRFVALAEYAFAGYGIECSYDETTQTVRITGIKEQCPFTVTLQFDGKHLQDVSE